MQNKAQAHAAKQALNQSRCEEKSPYSSKIDLKDTLKEM